MDDKKKPTSIRVDPDLWEEFKKVAKIEKRSVRAQIELLMEQAVKKHKESEFPKDGCSGPDAATASIPTPQSERPYFPSIQPSETRNRTQSTQRVLKPRT